MSRQPNAGPSLANKQTPENNARYIIYSYLFQTQAERGCVSVCKYFKTTSLQEKNGNKPILLAWQVFLKM